MYPSKQYINSSRRKKSSKSNEISSLNHSLNVASLMPKWCPSAINNNELNNSINNSSSNSCSTAFSNFDDSMTQLHSLNGQTLNNKEIYKNNAHNSFRDFLSKNNNSNNFCGKVKAPTQTLSRSGFTSDDKDFPVFPTKVNIFSTTASEINNSIPEEPMLPPINKTTNQDPYSYFDCTSVNNNTELKMFEQTAGAQTNLFKNIPFESASTIPKINVNISLNGKITNIPKNVLRDQFGMLGFELGRQTTLANPHIGAWATGEDLLNLGLHLDTPFNVFPSFPGPFTTQPLGIEDTEYHIPPEYLINNKIRETLPPVNLSMYSDEVLFFLFYTFFKDNQQLLAAQALYERGWRFHKELLAWLTHSSENSRTEQTDTSEKGLYCVFDSRSWTKIQIPLVIDYASLDGCPKTAPQQ